VLADCCLWPGCMSSLVIPHEHVNVCSKSFKGQRANPGQLEKGGYNCCASCLVDVCMYEKIYNVLFLTSYSLSSHECAPIGHTKKMCL